MVPSATVGTDEVVGHSGRGTQFRRPTTSRTLRALGQCLRPTLATALRSYKQGGPEEG